MTYRPMLKAFLREKCVAAYSHVKKPLIDVHGNDKRQKGHSKRKACCCV